MNPKPEAKKGIVSLQDSPFWKDKKIISLGGEWNFLWKKFQTNPQNEDFSLIQSGVSWNRQTLANGEKIPSYGFGTYQLKVSLDHVPHEYSLKINGISGAYELYINGKKIGGQGIIGKNSIDMIPSIVPKIYDLGTFDKPEMNISILVSNYHHSKGGIWEPILLGTKAQIHSLSTMQFIQYAFIVGALFIISLYYFAMYSFSTRNLSPLYFGGFCLMVAIYFFITNESILYFLNPDFSIHAKYWIEYMNLIGATLFGVLYFYETYPEAFYSKFIYAILILLGIVAAFVILFPIGIYTEIIPFLQLIMAIAIVYIGVSLFLLAWKLKDGTSIFFVGVLLFSITVCVDIFAQWGWIQTIPWTPWGVMMFVFSQGFLLSKNFNLSMNTVFQLTNELMQTSEAYARFVPKEFLAFLGKSEVTNIRLGDVVKKEASVLFCDIRSFTSLTEKSEPSELFLFLNSYFDQMNKLIIKHNGIIDKYIGDAILAVFPEKPEDALYCAIDMQKILNDTFFSLGDQETKIEAGIALHFGELLLGVIGGEKLLQTTVISDTVNTCSRLQSLTKTYGSSIIISETILQNLDDPSLFHFRFLDYARVAGKSESIFICEVYDHESEIQKKLKQITREAFDRAVTIYQSGEYTKAWQMFIDVLKENPQDSAAIFYLNRTATFLVKGTSLIHDFDDLLVEWKPEWATGIKLIDEQHMILFDIINELHKAQKFKREREVLSRILENLKIYVFTHFTMEEELMLRFQYPDFENHKKQHTKFIQKMESLVYDHSRANVVDTEEVLVFLKDWLISHIKRADKEGYVPYIPKA